MAFNHAAEAGASLSLRARRIAGVWLPLGWRAEAGVAGARLRSASACYSARPALACIIGARLAWTVEMISSKLIPSR